MNGRYGGSWKPVIHRHNRQSFEPRKTLFTLFIDNLPEDVGKMWFRKFYSQFGEVICIEFLINVKWVIRRVHKLSSLNDLIFHHLFTWFWTKIGIQ